MAILEVKSSDPNYAEYKQRIANAMKAMGPLCGSKAKTEDIFCDAKIGSSKYVLVYPLLMADVIRSRELPPDASAGDRLGQQMAKFSVRSPGAPKDWNCHSIMFFFGERGPDTAIIDERLGYSSGMKNCADKEGTSPDIIIVPLPAGADRAWGVIVTDFNNDGLFDFATVAPNGISHLFLTTGTPGEEARFRKVDIFKK